MFYLKVNNIQPIINLKFPLNNTPETMGPGIAIITNTLDNAIHNTCTTLT